MTIPAEHICTHCGIRFRWTPLNDGTGVATELAFCCRGCLGAYQLVCAAGLDEFYRRNDRDLPTVADNTGTDFRENDLTGYVVDEGQLCRVDILVAGISCPSCIWLLERMVTRVDGVSDVSITYAGGIASVRFDPARTAPSEIFAVIARLGFVPRPYSPELSELEDKRERIDLLLRFGTALFLTMQLMAYSYGLYAGYFQGIGAAIKAVLQYASLAVATPVVFYSGWPFIVGAWRSLLSKQPGMDLLIAVGTLSAWTYSCWALQAGGETYFESAAMIVTFVLLGRLLELSVRRSARSGIQALYAAAPQRAMLMERGEYRDIAAADVRPGDLLLVRQGERFPVDCLIVEHEAEVDQSLVTGESVPVVVGPGGEVRAGSLNVSAPVTVQALRPVGQSYLMRVAAMVRMAQAGKPLLQRLADRVAAWFVPAVLLLALVIFTVKVALLGQDAGRAFMVALAVVLIACPCAMGLAVPAAVLAACSRSATLGILLRGGDVIERLALITDCLLDKTGTITMGTPQVISCSIHDGFGEHDLLRCAATLEHRAAHPLARAIVGYCADRGERPGECHGFVTFPGKGISGYTADNRKIICGSSRLFEEQGLNLNVNYLPGANDETVVLVAVDGVVAGRFVLHDVIRPGTGDLVRSFATRKVAVGIVSGDAQPVVDRIAGQVGTTSGRGNLTPDRKLELVQALQERGGRVLMAGDGVNDAPALAAADVSCSLTGSSDIALENADVIISADDLSRLATAHRIAVATMTVIRQNLAWAFVYNIIGIPLALCGLLTPVYAAVAMTASSLLVSLNSLRLMRFKHHG